MGEVYRAKDDRLDRVVAIKVLPSDLASDHQLRLRLENEARAIAALSHPHICALHDIGYYEGLPFLVLEYLDGETLREQLTRGALQLDQALGNAIEIADALSEAHRRGVVHRDLKPSNIMLTKTGVKLLDFGVAKWQRVHHVSDATTRSVREPATGYGVLVGTPLYMAPEQIEGHEADTRSDLFSLGSVIFEMITGVRAFHGEADAGRLAAILHADRPPTGAGRPRVPVALERLIKRCLARRPEHRPQTAQIVATELRGIAARFSRHQKRGAAGPKGRVRRTPASKPSSRSIRALAVLPLEDLSGDPSQEYFADGMTEALIASLAKIPALRVISRTSTMRYKAAHRPLRDIARELNVDAIVEGSVIRAAGRVRVTAELIHAQTDSHLWADSYNRDLSGILQVQDEVAEAIAKEIRIQLTSSQRAHFRAARAVNSEAYEHYLRARFALHGVHSMKQSFDGFKLALQHDPTFAEAHAGIADWYLVALLDKLVTPEEGIRNAITEAQRALELNHDLAEAHASLGRLKTLSLEFVHADQHLRQAIHLKPGYAHAHRWHARLLSYLRRHGEATLRVERAQALDPLSSAEYVAGSSVYYIGQDFERAVAESSRALELDPHSSYAYYFRAFALTFRGEFDQAWADFRRSIELSKGHPSCLAGLGYSYARAGRIEDARAVLTQLIDLAARPEDPRADPVALAELHAGLGDTTDAIECLERAFKRRQPELAGLYCDPVFEPLRPDPRFQALLHRIGFGV
jgi:serine/threonine protein kinase/Flp pilus assembly protein TadD